MAREDENYLVYTDWDKLGEELKKEDKQLSNRYLDCSGGKLVRIKNVYSDSLLEWHEPESEEDISWYQEHEETLAKVRGTGRCPCGASVEEGSGNYLQDLGYLYGVECLECR